MKMRSIALIGIGLLTALSSKGAESSPPSDGGDGVFKPGLSWMAPKFAAEVEAAVEARRGKTALSKLADSMKPGTWAELKTTMPEGLWQAPSEKRLHIGTWSDDGHWDSRTGQFLFFGVRQARKFVAYSEVNNTWDVIEFQGVPNAPAVPQKFGHQYSGNAHDLPRSQFYIKGRRYDVQTGAWTITPTYKKASREKSMTRTWSSAMDGLLVLLFQDSGELRHLKAGQNKWTDLGQIPVHGYHSMARDNPFRQEVLFAGGNDSQRVTVITKDGKAKRMKDFPIPGDFTIRRGILTVDPRSGRYLFKIGTKFVEFDSATNEYRLIADFTKTPWPFSKHEAPLVAFIPEYGVTMWADKKVMLYKHKVCSGKPLPGDPPAIDTKEEGQ
ncbi:MAG: hypothetical protein R6U98_24830 [Pirellulaceae bacterium]